MEGLSPVQKRMFELLLDGESHSKEELHGCLHDELGPLENIRVHLSIIRQAIADRGGFLVCNEGRKAKGTQTTYRMLLPAKFCPRTSLT